MKTYTIKKTTGVSLTELYKALNDGGKIVIYGYCISIIALTFRLVSSPHFIRPGEKASKYRLRYNMLSLIFGWWGFPWGPIYTVDMIKINLKNGGGMDVTDEMTVKIKEKYNSLNEEKVFSEDITVELH